MALDQVRTPFVFLSDIDFLPMPNMYSVLKKYIQSQKIVTGRKVRSSLRYQSFTNFGRWFFLKKKKGFSSTGIWNAAIPCEHSPIESGSYFDVRSRRFIYFFVPRLAPRSRSDQLPTLAQCNDALQSINNYLWWKRRPNHTHFWILDQVGPGFRTVRRS